MHPAAGTSPAPSRLWSVAASFTGLLLSLFLLCQCTMSRPHPPELGTTNWRTGDGKTLPYSRWPVPPAAAPEKPKAVLLCIHGLSGAASDFWPLGEKLPARDILVYALQLRGQGNDPDPSARGRIHSADQWQHDLFEFHALLARQYPGVPIFWQGESMGALISLHAATRLPAGLHVAGLVLASPPVALRQHVPGWKYALLRTAAILAPNRRIPIESLDPATVRAMKITSDANVAEQTPVTPHFVKAQSLRLLTEIDRMMRGSDDAARRLAVPLLVLYTPRDPVASQESVEAWFEHVAAPDRTRLFHPESYHLILHDSQRWQAVEQIEKWIEHRLPAPRH